MLVVELASRASCGGGGSDGRITLAEMERLKFNSHYTKEYMVRRIRSLGDLSSIGVPSISPRD